MAGIGAGSAGRGAEAGGIGAGSAGIGAGVVASLRSAGVMPADTGSALRRLQKPLPARSQA